MSDLFKGEYVEAVAFLHLVWEPGWAFFPPQHLGVFHQEWYCTAQGMWTCVLLVEFLMLLVLVGIRQGAKGPARHWDILHCPMSACSAMGHLQRIPEPHLVPYVPFFFCYICKHFFDVHERIGRYSFWCQSILKICIQGILFKSFWRICFKMESCRNFKFFLQKRISFSFILVQILWNSFIYI